VDTLRHCPLRQISGCDAFMLAGVRCAVLISAPRFKAFYQGEPSPTFGWEAGSELLSSVSGAQPQLYDPTATP
jgi:hypothetical protein